MTNKKKRKRHAAKQAENQDAKKKMVALFKSGNGK